MNQCKDCEHWDNLPGGWDDAKPEEIDAEYGQHRVCGLIRLGHYHYATRNKVPLAYTQDASGYRAQLWCHPDFGCVLWKAK